MSVVTGANGGEVGVWAEAEPAITADAAKNSVTNLFILFSFRGVISAEQHCATGATCQDFIM